MTALFLTAAFLFGTPTVDTCEACTPRKLCTPHASEVADGLKEVKAGLQSEDVETRLEALARAAELNAGHTNAPAKDVTKVIAAALEDEDLGVKTAAAELLGTSQDPETAVVALCESSTDVARLLAEVKRDHPDAEAAMKFALTVVKSISGYRDDRSVEALGNLLERYASAIYGDVVYRIVDGLTDLAAQEGIKALVTYYVLMDGFGTFPRLGKYVHEKLAEMVAAHELEGAPPWSDDGVSEDWRRWYKKNAHQLPRKLGKASLKEE